MLEIDLRLYGAFREYSQEPLLRFELSPGSTLGDLRAVLLAKLELLQPGRKSAELLASSVFADSDAILPEDYRIVSSQALSIIPPVCGG